MIRNNALLLLTIAYAVSTKGYNAVKIESWVHCDNVIDNWFLLLTHFNYHDIEPYDDAPVLNFTIPSKFLTENSSVGYVALQKTRVKGLSNLHRTEYSKFLHVFGRTGCIIHSSTGRLTVLSQGLLVIDGKRQPITLSMTGSNDIYAKVFLIVNKGEPSIHWIELSPKSITTTHGDLGSLENSFRKDSVSEAFTMISRDFFHWLFEKELVRLLNEELRKFYKTE